MTNVNGYQNVVLKEDAAVAFQDLARAFQREFGYLPKVTDSYRSLEVQTRIFLERFTRQYIPGAVSRIWQGNTWYLRPGYALAAVPGYSVHGSGQAVDLGSGINVATSIEHRWMDGNAHRYGWKNPNWAKERKTFEPWHWEYQGGYVHPTPATVHPGGVAAPTEGDEDMPYILTCGVKGHPQYGRGWVVVPQGNGKPRATTAFGGVTNLKEITVTDPRTWAGIESSIQFA